MPADRVFVEGIKVYAFGGVTEEERTVGQHYVIDIVAELADATLDGLTSLDGTVNYAQLYEIAVYAMRSKPFTLVEHKAAEIAEEIFDQTRASTVTVRLRKLNPPVDGMVAAAGVEITRKRRSPD